MLRELHPVFCELARLRDEKKRGLSIETCRGQCLRPKENKPDSLSFHCYEPQCNKKHEESCYRKFGKKGVVVEEHFREQVAVSELCKSFEGVPIFEQLDALLPTLRPLEEHWDISGSQEDRASFESLFDETAQLLALLHMEAHDREIRDRVDPQTLYGPRILEFLGNAIKELWRADLNGHIYNNIASHLRILAEELVLEGLKRLADAAERSNPQIPCKDVEKFSDKVLEITRLQSELSSRGELEIAAFQEPCLLVQQFASSSGSHANTGHEHFELAGNLGNNYIIICRAIVHACALYSKFAVNCSADRHRLSVESLNKEEFLNTYLRSLKTKLLREVPLIFERCKDMGELVRECIVLQEEFGEVRSWCDQLAQGLQERLKQRAINSNDDLKLADNLRKLVQDAYDLVVNYADLKPHGQLIHAVFGSKKDLQTLRKICHGLQAIAGQLQNTEVAEHLGKSAWLYKQEDVNALQEMPFAQDLLRLVSPSTSAPKLSFDVGTMQSALRKATDPQVDRMKHYIKATLRPGPQLKIGHLDMRVLWALGIEKDASHPLSARPPEHVTWEQFRVAFPMQLHSTEKGIRHQVNKYLDREARLDAFTGWDVFQSSVRQAALKELNHMEEVGIAEFDYDMRLSAVEVDCSFQKTKDVLNALRSCVEEGKRAGTLAGPAAQD